MAALEVGTRAFGVASCGGFAVSGEQDTCEAQLGLSGSWHLCVRHVCSFRGVRSFLDCCLVVLLFSPIPRPFLGKSISLAHVFLFSDMSGVGVH